MWESNMKYNVARHSYLSTDTISGTVSYTTEQLISILTFMPVTLSGNAVLILDCDLGERVRLEDMRYYFSSTQASGTVASGIKFYYKNDSIDNYTHLNTTVGSGYYYTAPAGVWSPRYLRVVHTTTDSGTVDGFSAINYDDIVDFGTDGTQTETNFDLAIQNVLSEVRAVPVYNDGTTTADAYAMVEWQNDISDDVFKIGLTDTGPWYGPKDTVIANGDNWTEGSTLTSLFVAPDDTLILAIGQTTGNFRTNVLTTPEESTFSHLILDYNEDLDPAYISFYDPFNESSENIWEVLAGTVEYDFGYMRLPNTSIQRQNITINYIYFGYDFEVTFRWRWPWPSQSIETNNAYVFTRFFDTSGSVPFEVRLQAVVPTRDQEVRFYVDGSQVHYWRGGSYEFRDTLYWFKIKREFNTIRFKYWDSSGAEPGSWASSTTFNETETYYKIEARANADAEPPVWYEMQVITNALVSDPVTSFPRIAVDSTDTQPTVEVRSSDTKPQSYDTYTRCNQSGSTIVLQEYDKGNDSLLSTSGDLTTLGVHQDEQSWDETDARIAIDEYTNRKAVIFKWHHQDNDKYDIMNLSIVEPDGSISTVQLTNDDATGTKLYPYFIDLDVFGGVWFYAYVDGTDADDGVFFDTQQEYYLGYFDNTLTNQFKTRSDEGFAYDASVVYNTGEIWYTNPIVSAVLKRTKSGTINVSYSTTQDLKGIVATSDGGCYYIQGTGIFRLDYEGNLIDSIYVDGLSGPTRIVVDGTDPDYLWIIDDIYLRKINTTDSRVLFSIAMPLPPAEIQALEDGVLVFCTDRIWRFVDNSPNIYKVLDPGTENTYRYGLSISHENSYYSYSFPLSSDAHWNALGWKKVALDYYNLSQDKYKQFRITFQAADTGHSPVLNAVYLQEAVLVEDIPAQGYKNVYLKADITDSTEEDVGSYNTNLKTWWYIPI